MEKGLCFAVDVDAKRLEIDASNAHGDPQVRVEIDVGNGSVTHREFRFVLVTHDSAFVVVAGQAIRSKPAVGDVPRSLRN